jgi:molybdopterin converting factor small subunit
MKITVNTIGVEVRLKQEITLDPASPALKDVLGALMARDGGELGRFVDGDLSLVDCSVLLVNGRNILSLDGWATEIHAGDELTFMVPVAGG